MLPLVQMQPCATSRSTHSNTRASLRPPSDYLDHDRYARHHAPSAFPRAFPIRTSQSHRRTTLHSSSPYPPRSDHHLRRKNEGPSGLATPGVSRHGHLSLPTSSALGAYQPYPPPFPPPQLSQVPWTSASRPFAPRNQIEGGGASWTSNNEPWTPYATEQAGHGGLQPPFLGSFANQNSFSKIYQPVMRANEYNVRAFCPPPMPMAEALPFGYGGWQPSPSPWDYQGAGYIQNPRASQPIYGNHHMSNIHGLNQPSSMRLPYELIDDFSYKPAHHGPGGFSRASFDFDAMQNTLGPGPNANAQQGFRQRAMSQAHEAYVDLISHLQTHSKMRESSNGSRAQGQSKVFIYPKPPNPVPMGGFYNSSGTPFTTNSKHVEGVHPSAQPSFHRSSSLGGTPGHHPAAFSSMSGGIVSAHPQYVPTYPSWDGVTQNGYLHYASQARASLEVLNALCEQSGWKWTDGMLLGGCLHYALESYESALSWFSRVTAIDSSHVVALTDIAATLYCLGRPDEAEKHWLEAAKLCPGYLESTEHLVGLLYRKRSKDAVEIITFVQDALRLSDPGERSSVSTGTLGLVSSSTSMGSASSFRDSISSTSQKGFGSSGYALPGSENGRILALVHAKGTMLYSSKEVDRASGAFEEAVLISIGRRADGIHHLVRRIQTVLGSEQSVSAYQPIVPLLLPPEKARQTAQLVFSGNGELPGLAFVQAGGPKRAASQTTSNSLLSLAKIFQDSMSNGASGPGVLRRPSGVGDILALYYLSLSLQESPSTANNVGILLAGIQQAAPSSSVTASDTGKLSSIPGVLPGSGLALALSYYQYGLRLDPKHVHLHTNLGSLLKDIGQLDLAIQMYEQAVSCDGTFDIALTNLANAVKDRGRIKDAIAYYKRAVDANPEFSEAVCGLLTALNSVCDWKGRGGAILDGGRLDRWHVDNEGALVDAQSRGHGSGLTKRVVSIVGQQLYEASLWGCNSLQNEVIDALSQRLAELCELTAADVSLQLRAWKGKAWEGARLLRLVERASRVMLRQWYQHQGHDHKPGRFNRLQLPSNLTIPSAPTVLPFHTFTCPLEPRDIRAISQRNASRIACATLKSPWVPPAMYSPPSPPNPHLNVGYLSSDFNNHPLAHLMQSVFGFHNPQRARAFCYATTGSDKSVYRQKIEKEAPVFRDVSNWSPDRLVEQIVKDGIHILVNLNGYTRGARNEIFAVRPAPIQMSFMGFAGTLGAEWCDYILADSTAIPMKTLRPWRSNVGIEDIFRDEMDVETGGWVYSENIIFCRDTFFCCDHAQTSDPKERQVTWAEEQTRRWQIRKVIFPSLPDDTVILGNFNQLYKIEPTTFRSWLRILARVPKSVLWLLRFPELGEANLRATAESWAGPEVAGRLVFTDVAPKNQHISRASICDLFLDTPECNAHTTAADVLWSSTPLLTHPRYSYKMCSRMAASILKGALPKSDEGYRAASELIATSEAEYEQKAIALAGGLLYQANKEGLSEGSGRLWEMRKILWDSKWHCALFNTRRWVDDVETAYEEAWRRWVAGEGGDIYL